MELKRLCVILVTGGALFTRISLLSGEDGSVPETSMKTEEGFAGDPPFGLIVESLTPKLVEQLGTPKGRGVAVKEVLPRSDAVAAGVQPGDLIEAVNRVAVHSKDDYERAVQRTKRGEGVPVIIRRGQKTFLTGFQLQPDTSEGDSIDHRPP